jgi:hypothetical protein
MNGGLPFHDKFGRDRHYSRIGSVASAVRVSDTLRVHGNEGPPLFKGRHFEAEIIILCVRWYLRYPLSLR